MDFGPRKPILSILGVAFAARVLWILASDPNSITFGDAADYLQAAQSFCLHQPYPVRGHLPFFRAPFYPLFLAFITFCRTTSFFWIKLIQAALDTGSVWLIYHLGRITFQNQKIALLAAAIGAIYPPLIYPVKEIQTETLYTFLFLAAVIFLFRNLRQNHNRHLMFCGIFFGLAALTRPVTPGFLPFLFLWLLISMSFSNAFKRGALISIFFVLVILPWTIRNYRQYGEWIFISDASGYAFWKYNNETSWNMLTAKDPEEYKKFTYALENTETQKHYDIIRAKWSKLRDQERAWYRLAFDYMKQDKLGWLGQTLYKVAYFWRPWLNPFDYSRPLVLFSFLIFTVIYTLGVIGIFVFWNSHRNEVIFFLLLFLFTTIVHSLFLPGIRYRTCLVDPYMIVLAAAASLQFWKKFRMKSQT